MSGNRAFLRRGQTMRDKIVYYILSDCDITAGEGTEVENIHQNLTDLDLIKSNR